MPFQYQRIDTYVAREDELFLFDANIWLFWLNYPGKSSSQKAPYTRFFNHLLSLRDEPVVLLPACVLSEVLNRFLNKGPYFHRFMKSPAGVKGALVYPDPQDQYKKVYREDPQFYRDRNGLYDSIQSFSPNLELIQDGFNDYGIEDLKLMHTDLDFTDWQIWEAGRTIPATIVTDDGDFILENFPIVTGNQKLLGRNP